MDREIVLARIKHMLDTDGFPTSFIEADEWAPRRRLMVELGPDQQQRPLPLMLDLMLEAENSDAKPGKKSAEQLNVLHCLALLPFQLTSPYQGDVARMMMLINTTSEFPGFIVNEMGNAACFRHTMVSVNEAADRETLRKIIGVIAFYVDAFTKPLEQIATGQRTIEQILAEGM